MSYEYTVVQPFTLPKGTGGQFRPFVIGQKITDADDIEAVLAQNARNVSRHAITTPAEAPEKAADADPAGEATPTATNAPSPPATAATQTKAIAAASAAQK